MSNTTTPEEYKARRKLLTDALRSGQYKQGQNQLAQHADHECNPNDMLYCCLGVACEIFRQKVDRGGWNGTSYDLPATDDKEADTGSVEFLPYEIQEWYGFQENDGGFVSVEDEECDKSSLAILNDDAGYNFLEIAKVIDSEPKGLFVK